ncbi:hypothetical protein N657DRAFT_689379 [Parathielavia appendiculata]|uniref:Uncharacterized protein n=1 Tax=Parathielavia appendiculata TaxID=2587402 RepID=A0AAN6U283_9PEZI|nr:hypothetical protein N657DRAFT_689379 [Parathielavia appendiculata]
MDSSKTTQQQKKDTSQPTEGSSLNKAADSLQAAFQAHSANPGPAMPKEFNVKEEGTKEERRAKADELNK